MAKVNINLVEDLSPVEEAGVPNYCYQCSSCVAECPAAQHFPSFNPREIVMATLLGVVEFLTGADSVIWQCTTCYKCYERCPQGTHPVEVITALKNLTTDRGDAPSSVIEGRDSILSHGNLIAPSEAINKRRERLGLEPKGQGPVKDINKILKLKTGKLST